MWEISKYNQLKIKRKELNLELSKIAKKEAEESERERKHIDPYQIKKALQDRPSSISTALSLSIVIISFIPKTIPTTINIINKI